MCGRYKLVKVSVFLLIIIISLVSLHKSSSRNKVDAIGPDLLLPTRCLETVTVTVPLPNICPPQETVTVPVPLLSTCPPQKTVTVTVSAPLPNRCPPQETVVVPVSARNPLVVSINKGLQKCDEILSKRMINPRPYSNKKACCDYAQNKSLPELCGVVNEATLGNRSLSTPACSCIDFMACKTVALTGISSDHYDEVQDAIASVQNFHPDMKILVYDLGLESCEINHLNSLHNVEVISFSFELYPQYVRHLQSYAWKIFGIHAILQEHEIVFWMDASVRLYRPITDKVLYDLQAFPYRAEMLYGFYDGMFTYDAMYEWFGVTRTQMGKKSQIESGKQFLRKCPFLYEKIYNELLKCANDQSCLEPPGHALICYDMPPERHPNASTRPEDVPNRNCSRYDQSALTIVLHKQFNLTQFSRPVATFTETLSVWRWYTTCYTLYTN